MRTSYPLQPQHLQQMILDLTLINFMVSLIKSHLHNIIRIAAYWYSNPPISLPNELIIEIVKKKMLSIFKLSLFKSIWKHSVMCWWQTNYLLSFYRSYYGTRGIANKWFKSYSCNHTQYVSINGFNSNHKLMKYGVAHGLALEPLIFLFFFY